MLSIAAPVLRFLECLVQDDAARTQMAALAIFCSAFSYHEERPLLADLCRLLLLEMEGLQSIHIVHHQGRYDRERETIWSIAQHAQCRISGFGLRSEGGFGHGFSDLYMIGKQLYRAALADRWVREQAVDVPKVVSMEMWRKIPSTCRATKGNDLGDWRQASSNGQISPLSFVLCPLSFVLCPLSFVLCPLSSAL
jgi:hypothetical protein